MSCDRILPPLLCSRVGFEDVEHVTVSSAERNETRNMYRPCNGRILPPEFITDSTLRRDNFFISYNTVLCDKLYLSPYSYPRIRIRTNIRGCRYTACVDLLKHIFLYCTECTRRGYANLCCTRVHAPATHKEEFFKIHSVSKQANA